MVVLIKPPPQILFGLLLLLTSSHLNLVQLSHAVIHSPSKNHLKHYEHYAVTKRKGCSTRSTSSTSAGIMDIEPFIYNNIHMAATMCSSISSRSIKNIRIRGGSSPIQPNPQYVSYNEFDPNAYMPPTLGDEQTLTNRNHILRPHAQNNQHQHQYYGTGTGARNRNHNFNSSYSNNYKLKPLHQVIQEFFIALHKSNPTLNYGILTSIAIFIAWQIPSPICTNMLKNHFVCSAFNIATKHRYHTLLTSTLSHTSISHLLMNLYGFYTFGKNVIPILQINKLSFATYCILSAIISNLFFLTLTPYGSCIGLSGVSLSLLALDAKLNPAKEIGFIFRFIPIRLPAQYALICLLLWSGFGVLTGGSDGIAHATHLGGLVYGIVIYELLNRGIYQKYVKVGRLFWHQWMRKLRRI
mmetsp:Transcript_18836/g.23113  ORF Transcript_18836/g.23113 Transcript_18836/m.23113 type:complete len:411 (+) Transcript_18836:107-1339(+)